MSDEFKKYLDYLQLGKIPPIGILYNSPQQHRDDKIQAEAFPVTEPGKVFTSVDRAAHQTASQVNEVQMKEVIDLKLATYRYKQHGTIQIQRTTKP